MVHLTTEQLTRMLASLQRRRSVALLVAALSAPLLNPAAAKDKSQLDRRRKRAEKRSSKGGGGKSRSNGKGKKKGNDKDKETGFSADCKHFMISAGPDKTDRFKHTDDDLFIELLPSGGNSKVLFKDDNNAPNGPGGSHLAVDPFTAEVGDRIRIVARNEEAGGCELDAIWLHCLDGKGGSIKLQDAISPAECAKNADTVGVFLDATVRLRNK